MSKYVFKASLSVDSINNLKSELLDYKNNILQQNIRKYVSALLDIGIKVSQAKVSESPLGKYITLTSEIVSGKNLCEGFIIAKGEIRNEVDKDGNPYPPFSTLLAVEFGAGSHYNPNPNPKADLFGMGVGTFPGQTHAFDDMWWYWDSKSESWKPTHGIKATMPMYSATQEMIKNATKIARTIF